MKVEDLDILLPPSRLIRIGGKEIDVSFIPCAITFSVDSIIQELAKIPQAKLRENGDESRQAFDLSVKLCSVFCEHLHPELDEEFFREKCNVAQVKKITEAIKDALMASYLTLPSDGGAPKNPQGPKVRKNK